MKFSLPSGVLASVLCLVATGLSAQGAVQVLSAELAVPFGVVSGQVVLVENQLVFIDPQNDGGSFAIARETIERIDQAGGVTSLTLRQPVVTGTVEQDLVRLRLTDSDTITAWHARARSGVGGPTRAASSRPAAADEVIYRVQHDHRIGSCEGRLLITDVHLAFESTSDADDSRQWAFADIREVDQDGIYQLRVTPFVGNTYNLQLVGRGLGSAEYRRLVDRVAEARLRP